MEFLKELLGEELYAQVSEKLNGKDNIKIANIADGSYIPKNKFDEINNNAKSYKTQLTDLQAQLETLKASAHGQEELQTQIANLQTELSKKDNEMKQNAFKMALKDKIRDFKVYDPDVIMPLLNMQSITQSDDGNIVGLKEQMDNMKANRPYLFAEDKPSKGGYTGGTNPLSNPPSLNDSINAAIRGAAGKN